ncbi:MAG: GLPGLI family protein [Rickettsiaceae bacterium]|nr:GLPGLI family protein [Rickettsiaceae bacterium]
MTRLIYFLPICVILLFQKNSLGQLKISDVAIYKVTYNFTHAYDTTDFNKKSTQSMTLYVGHSYSVYRSADYELLQREKKKQQQQIMEQLQTGDQSKPIISLASDVRKIPETEIFKKLDDNIFYRKEVLIGGDYLIEEIFPKINWKIDSETKNFGDLKSQKATGYFRGRTYSAWFAPQLPVRVGPWKLNGLPGLILEASDENKEVIFSFVSFERMQMNNSTPIELPLKYIKTDEKGFEKLYNLSKEDPVAFVTNRNAQRGLTVTFDGKSIEDLYNSKPRKKPTKSLINNFIEKAN